MKRKKRVPRKPLTGPIPEVMDIQTLAAYLAMGRSKIYNLIRLKKMRTTERIRGSFRDRQARPQPAQAQAQPQKQETQWVWLLDENKLEDRAAGTAVEPVANAQQQPGRRRRRRRP